VKIIFCKNSDFSQQSPIFAQNIEQKPSTFMLNAGEYQSLRIGRIADPGIYLTDEEGGEVLLPNRYVSLSDHVGDMVEVFVYHDSENRLIATREKPFATVGEAAVLEAVDRNAHGVFLNWGITAKDLFMPNRNVPFEVQMGGRYLVYLYRDNLTGRVVATTKLTKYISNAEISVRAREQVDILVARKMDMGYRVVINNRHWGMIYNDQIFSPVKVGDKLTGYIHRISAEGRIDVMLQQEGRELRDSATTKLLDLLAKSKGTLQVGDKSSPEEIAAVTGLSKKSFKKAVGALYKERKIALTDTTITLTK
jgi:predicted RNA-binding protein (virulence factor B family)